jgi:hypothetical protein
MTKGQVMSKKPKAVKTATKKVLVQTKPYTRVESLPALPKGVKLPSGYEPAYYRKRNTLAVLRAANRSHYLVFNISTGKKTQVANTKEASKLMSELNRGKKSSVKAAA